MPQPPLPSTGKFDVNPLSSIVLPHADTHESGGNDPVIPSVRFVALTTISTSTSSTSTSYADVTGSSTTFISRGGRLRIVFAGPRSASATGTGAELSTVLYVKAVLDSTNLNEYYLAVANQNEVEDNVVISIGEAGALVWYTTALSGKHTVKLQLKIGGSGSTTGYVGRDLVAAADVPCSLTVEEILPIRAE